MPSENAPGGADCFNGNPSATCRAASPFHVLVKPIGPICNLRCVYCYYLEKRGLYPGESDWRMPAAVLEKFTSRYIAGQPDEAGEVQFAWQGGEPTLLGVDFFRGALALQRKQAKPGLRIANTLQTNGTLLDDAWGGFLRENDFLVGLSLDGPPALHDRYRVDTEALGTQRAVQRGLDILHAHRVEFNTLTVIHRGNADHPREVYGFLKASGARVMQFIPNVQFGKDGAPTPWSVEPLPFGRFLAGVLDAWLAEDVGRIFVQNFETVLAVLMGLPAPLCVQAETCGRALALEHNGDLYSCDHFVETQHLLGNIMHDDLVGLVDGRRQSIFGRAKREVLARRCLSCGLFQLCRGGCPAQRWRSGRSRGLNYLCEGFQSFFAHAKPYFTAMADCLRAGQPAAEYWRRLR